MLIGSFGIVKHKVDCKLRFDSVICFIHLNIHNHASQR